MVPGWVGVDGAEDVASLLDFEHFAGKFSAVYAYPDVVAGCPCVFVHVLGSFSRVWGWAATLLHLRLVQVVSSMGR